MYVAVDGSYAGTVVISDELRPQAVEVVKKLREKAWFMAILTGDNEASARETAKIVGADGLYFSLPPEEKLSVMRGIRKERGVIVSVGDGINDAPMLAGANAGCTIGLSSTDAAGEAANLMLLPQTIDLVRRTMLTAKINVTLALVIKVAVMVLGYAQTWMAVFAEVEAALLCVLVA